MDAYIRFFDDWDPADRRLLGSKGAYLSDLSRAGFAVPQGFVITTTAYTEAIRRDAVFQAYLDQLDRLQPEQWDERRQLGEKMRQHLQQMTLSAPLQRALEAACEKLDSSSGWAIRSSATAEDLPYASFSGQQDSFLNVHGKEALHQGICDCWASLFTDRAMAYRVRYAVAPRDIGIAVIVQEMVHADASGMLFTAHPENGHRGESLIQAHIGLAHRLHYDEADLFYVKQHGPVKSQSGKKQEGLFAAPNGGIQASALTEKQQQVPVLSDEQAQALARIGRFAAKIFDAPQIIEWCLKDGDFWLVQTRPLRNLYPLPKAKGLSPYLYLSVGHLQQYTDAMPPLAWSSLAHMLPLIRPAGSRLYLDIGGFIGHPLLKKHLPYYLMQEDPALGRDLYAALAESLAHYPWRRPSLPNMVKLLRLYAKALQLYHAKQPALIRRQIMQALENDPFPPLSAQPLSENELRHIATRFKKLMPRLAPAWLAATLAQKNLDYYLHRLNQPAKEIMSLLLQVQADRPTVAMGLALGDLADLARGNKALLWLLRQPLQEDFMKRLKELPTTKDFYQALQSFLKTYGTHTAGGYHLALPCWQEQPWQLAPLLLAQINSRSAAAHRKRFEEQQQEANACIKKLYRQSWRRGPLFALRFRQALKTYMALGALQEAPKLALSRELARQRQRFLALGKAMTEAECLATPDDIFFLTLPELTENAEWNPDALARIIRQRKHQFAGDRQRIPPRVMLGNGRVVHAKSPDSHAPNGALSGTGAAPGSASGRARIVFDPLQVQVAPGDILVCPYADPDWTPLFRHIAGIISETGGLMSDTAIAARKAGIPAVIGVAGATTRIQEGDRIQINGHEGWVDLLHDE